MSSNIKINARIYEELNRELVYSSLAAAPGFLMVAAWITYNKFATIVYANWITYLGICLMILPTVRFILSLLYQKNKLSLSFASKFTKINIVINAVLWSTAFLLSIFEYELSHMVSSINLIALVISLAISSIITLSYSLYIAYAFQWIIMIPNAAYLYYLSYNKDNTPAFQLAVIFTIGAVYMLKQTRDFNRQIKKRLTYALELENANNLLKESQDLLIIERAKLQNSIRLATLGEISGELAHEINNPLCIVQGNIDLCLISIKSKNPDFQSIQTRLQKAVLSITRITKIIKALRYFSREIDDQEPFIPIDINKIIEETIDFCSEKFNSNRIKVQLNNSDIFKVNCRPVEISQVLLNLFSNAIKAFLDVPAENRKISISVSASNTMVRIAVSNSGEKINADIISKLFIPFFTTNDNRNGLGVGMSLGLSTSKKIVEAHHGLLYHDPQPAETTFVIELPQYKSA